jgi:hypothetical protein
LKATAGSVWNTSRDIRESIRTAMITKSVEDEGPYTELNLTCCYPSSGNHIPLRMFIGKRRRPKLERRKNPTPLPILYRLLHDILNRFIIIVGLRHLSDQFRDLALVR